MWMMDEREAKMINCLVAHCPTAGCYMRVPVCTLKSDTKPEFDPTLSIAVTCHSCGKEFREPASQLEFSPLGAVTGKFQAIRRV
jgi:RNase P subunit RPR2